jgi:hypothetical protein
VPRLGGPARVCVLFMRARVREANTNKYKYKIYLLHRSVKPAASAQRSAPGAAARSGLGVAGRPRRARFCRPLSPWHTNVGSNGGKYSTPITAVEANVTTSKLAQIKQSIKLAGLPEPSTSGAQQHWFQQNIIERRLNTHPSTIKGEQHLIGWLGSWTRFA